MCECGCKSVLAPARSVKAHGWGHKPALQAISAFDPCCDQPLLSDVDSVTSGVATPQICARLDVYRKLCPAICQSA